jgi:hypothetical protein
MVSTVMVVVLRETGLLQVLRGWDPSPICGVLELRSQRVQLGGFRVIAAAGSRLRGLCEIVGNGAYELVELRRTLYLKLLQFAQETGSW